MVNQYDGRIDVAGLTSLPLAIRLYLKNCSPSAGMAGANTAGGVGCGETVGAGVAFAGPKYPNCQKIERSGDGEKAMAGEVTGAETAGGGMAGFVRPINLILVFWLSIA